MHIQIGLPDPLRADAACLYGQAFGAKLAFAIPDTDARVRPIEAALQPAFAVVALDGDELVGLAGFQTPGGSLTGGVTAGGLVRQLSPWRGLRAIAVFALYERTPAPGEMAMDGIVVDAGSRGQGIGSALLNRLAQHAAEQGFTHLRLDVIVSNDGARRLYERRGSELVGTERFEVLRGLLGFGASTTLVRDLTPIPSEPPPPASPAQRP